MIPILNKEFLNDSRGQMQQTIQAAVGVIVVFVTLSLGMTLVSNFQGNITTSPQNAVPLNNLWPLAVGGVTILVLVVSLLRIFQ